LEPIESKEPDPYPALLKLPHPQKRWAGAAVKMTPRGMLAHFFPKRTARWRIVLEIERTRCKGSSVL
jgi:hypothetical protein